MSLQERTTYPLFTWADGFADAARDSLLLVARVLLAWLFLASGFNDLTNIGNAAAYLAGLGVSPALPLAWCSAIFEVALGAVLILGFATRYAALATFCWVAITIAIGHRYWTYPPEQQYLQYIQFLKNLSIMGGALFAFVNGAGRYAVDAVLARR